MLLEKQKSETPPSGVVTEDKVCPVTNMKQPIQLTNFISGKKNYDTLHYKSDTIKCTENFCMGSIMAGQSNGGGQPGIVRPKEEILAQAKDFLTKFYHGKKGLEINDIKNRLNEITKEIEDTGVYTHTTEELLFASKTAWRNAPRCIGRIQWNKLELQDSRHVKTTKEMYEALCHHLKFATNEGNIRSMITVFPPRQAGRSDFRVWNPQLVNFAGYLQEDGSIIGDPARVQLTRACQRLGWKGGKGGRFDILPWVLEAPGEGPKFYDVPEELILKFPIEHPKYPSFSELGIEWYAVPAVADMLLDAGGIEFPACPFNGWYMGTEIGARNICDPQRLNMTETIAKKLDFDTSSPLNLWKDQVLIEVNLAILYSFQKNNATIVDHHTASESFMKFMDTEQRQRGGCPADWVWICPPMSASVTPVFHQEMICYNLKPSYEYQEKGWKLYDWKSHSNIQLKYHLSTVAKGVLFTTRLLTKVQSKRVKATILFATETGKSDSFAQQLLKVLHSSFFPRVICMDEYEKEDLASETLFFVVASTFGSGEPPDNGKTFWKDLQSMKQLQNNPLSHIKFGVFALGSSSYPNFCAFGKNVDETLQSLGAQRLAPIGFGDEMKGQEQSFNQWLQVTYKSACNAYDLTPSENIPIDTLSMLTWKEDNFRVIEVENKPENLQEELSKLHRRKVFTCKMHSRNRLQKFPAEKQTILAKFQKDNNSELLYEPGDHMAVFPKNSSSIVSYILGNLKERGHAEFDALQLQILSEGQWKPVPRLPSCSLKSALENYLDLSTPPNANMLLALSKMAANKWDEYRLKQLSLNEEEYDEWKNFKFPNLQDVLLEFPSIKLEPAWLLSQLPLLQPRYYSISSSPMVTPDQIHLTMSLVSYKTQDGKGPWHYGVATSYVNNLPAGQDVHCFTKNASNFHLPKSKGVPIIMIGAGSGIAPFRSFWKHRELEMAEDELGNMILFFGCRGPKDGNIYHHEIVPLMRKRILSHVFYAFSREPTMKKKYVQDLVKEQGSFVSNLISSGAHIYICGDAVMADGVKKVLVDVLNGQEAWQQLVNENRYHEDVFGVLHRPSTVTKEL